MKKVLLVVMAILIVTAGLVACGTPQEPVSSDSASPEASASEPEKAEATDAEPVELSWAVFETDNYTAEFYQHIIDAFEADNPGIKIKKVLMTGDSRPQFLKTMMSAGNMPDINIDPVDLASIDGVYAEVPADLLTKYEDAAVVEFNGKKNLIPAYKALRAQVYYNKDMFKQAGIDTFPTTKEEFKEACQKLQDAGFVPLITSGAKDIWATGFGYFTAATNSDVYAKYPEFNKDLKEGKASFTDQVFVDSLTYWQDLQKAGYFHKGSMSFSLAQAEAEFLKGSAAMMLDGSWVAPSIDNGDNEEAKAQIGVAVFPTDAKNYCTMPQYWAVSETCANKDAAFKFCEYVLGGNEDIYRYYLQADGSYSVTKDPVTYEQGPLQTEFAENYDGFTLVPEIVKLPGDYALPTGLEDFMMKSLQNVFTGADVAQELKTWDDEYAKLSANSGAAE